MGHLSKGGSFVKRGVIFVKCGLFVKKVDHLLKGGSKDGSFVRRWVCQKVGYLSEGGHLSEGGSFVKRWVPAALLMSAW